MLATQPFSRLSKPISPDSHMELLASLIGAPRTAEVKHPPSILEVMADPDLFGPWFAGDSWLAWRAFLAGVFALSMTPEMHALWMAHTGRTPTGPAATEAWMIVGRRGGKSRIAALIAVYLACFRNYEPYLSPGEVATLPVIAADRKEARTVMRYVKAYLEVPALRSRVTQLLTESVSLRNHVQIEVHTAGYRAVRGYTILAAICDEIAFWAGEGGADPDTEVLHALRPGMASIPGAMLIAISSPYARKGVLWDAYRAHYGPAHDGDPVVVWQADTAAMNPGIDPQVIRDAYDADPAAAAAEYGAQFRTDVEGFVTRECVAGCTMRDRREIPPQGNVRYSAFVDPSGGSADSMTMAIAHRDGPKIVIDCVRERKPPFSPADVVAEFAATLKTYRVSTVTGDRYAGEWPREQFRLRGIQYALAEQVRSDLYRDLLPVLNSGSIELLDIPRLAQQLIGLERRTGRSGKDSIDHAPGGHDDLCNSVAGCAALCAQPRYVTTARTTGH